MFDGVLTVFLRLLTVCSRCLRVLTVFLRLLTVFDGV